MKATAKNGTPVVISSEDFPLVTCHCERCNSLLVADERGPDVHLFVHSCRVAAEDHRCNGLN